MKEIFKIILAVSFVILQINAKSESLKLLEEIETKLSCTKQFDEDENNTKLEDCIKKILEIKINEKNKYKVQLGVFSIKKYAENEVTRYDNWKKSVNVKGLESSKSEIIIKNGRFFVSVYQKGVSVKDLKKKIDEEGWFLKTYIPPKKITINIDNKIVKNSPDDRVKILKAKSDCYIKYRDNKLDKPKFKECLKKEAINAIQIHAILLKKPKQFNKICEDAKKKYDKGRNCQCIKKKVKGKTYCTIVETIDSSKQDIIKKIKQKKSEPFLLEKPEVLIK